jgi:hypothetical protein
MSKLKAKPPEQTKPGKIKALLYGASGVGKSWFSLTFPTPYYIDTEGGANKRHYQDRLKKAGGAYLGPQEGALSFEEVLDQVKALATEKHEHKTLVIDSITKLYQTAIRDEQERLGDKDAWGASKKKPVQYMGRLVSWIAKLDMNVWLVSHESTEWGVNPKTGQREEIGKQADVWDKLVYELDLALRAEKRGPSRVAVVKKSRLTGFPEGEAIDLDYAAFADRFGKDSIEGDVQTITLASVDDVAEVKRLLEVVKVAPEDIERWFKKAAVEDWADMTEEQIKKTISFMKGKI